MLLVRLDEGPMMYARGDGDPAALACDDRVVAVFVAASDTIGLVRFRQEAHDDG